MKKLFSSLFLTLALGVLLGAFCDVVKADDLTNDFWFLVSSDMNNIYSGSYNVNDMKTALNNDCSQYNYSSDIVKYVRFNIVNNGGYIYYFSSNPNAIYGASHNLSGSSDYENLGGSYDYGYEMSINYNNTLSMYCALVVSPSSVVLCRCFSRGTSSFNLSYPVFDFTGNISSAYERGDNRFIKLYGNFSGRCDFSFDNYLAKGENNYRCDISGHSYYFSPLPDFIEDDRLEIYTTFQSNDVKLLNIDLSKFRTGYSAAVSKSFSDVTVNLNCDGVDETFVLSSSTSSIVDIFSAYNEVYTLITPYSFFNLDQYEDVYISSVSFGLTTSSAGGFGTENFNIACQYYLKQVHVPLEPEEIPDPEYNDPDVYSDQQIQDMKSDLHEKSSRFSFVSGDWIFVQESDLPSFPFWATVYENYVWFADVNSDTTYQGHWWQMANNIPSVADLTRPFNPAEWFEQNKTFAFYDVILLKVWRCGVNVVGSVPVVSVDDLAGYLVCISDRYYDHYNSELNLDLIKQLQLSAENSVLFYDALKTRLDDLAEDMDFGFNSLTDINDGTQYKIIGWLKTIDTNISSSFTGLGSSLSSGFNSVVDAINNIVIPSGGSSYSLPALSDELEYLFKPSLEWSAINYNDYVESLGVLALPFEFTFDVLDIAENQYDSDLKLHINQLSVDVPLEAGTNPETTSFTVLSDQDIDFEPTSVIPSALWSTLQYLNAFGLVLVQALGTYNHIFRGGDK